MPRQQRHQDFSEEYVGRSVIVELFNGTKLVGRLVESRKYWVKVEVNGEGVKYINKGFIVSIKA